MLLEKFCGNSCIWVILYLGNIWVMLLIYILDLKEKKNDVLGVRIFFLMCLVLFFLKIKIINFENVLDIILSVIDINK